MAASGTTIDAQRSDQAGLDVEREELEWLLTSGVLGRSGNVARVLRYICEERFAGRADQIKEYSIAVEALGRRPNFDPQTDTIVRVTAHSLRKRLMDVYQGEGAGRPIRVVLPLGQYVPSFVQNSQSAFAVEKKPAGMAGPPTEEQLAGPVEEPHVAVFVAAPELVVALAKPANGRARWVIGIMIAVALAWACFAYWPRHDAKTATVPRDVPVTSQALPAPQELIRALVGPDRVAYTDRSGNMWKPDNNYCQGGTGVKIARQSIGSTEDPYLYLGGVRGIAHCIFPVRHGVYEVHLHFAETTELPAATRVATYSINAGPNVPFDVVDQAGGNGIATSTVIAGVFPESDGAIHLDFMSEVSPLNAVEILPATSAKLLPVRIVAQSASIADEEKRVWLSDRYFTGGRRSLPPESAHRDDMGVYASGRVGRFQYNIPVVPQARYRVKLYFREPWFGRENGAGGGPGSRVFDVTCNGAALLKNFDISREGGAFPVVKSFDHIEASADGRIVLEFWPVVNYPIVNAIEVLPDR